MRRELIKPFEKGTVAILCIVCLVFFMASGCGKQNVPALEEPTNLKGTAWKLAGVVDYLTGEFKKLDPVDCEPCYTLWFDTDYTAYTIGIDWRWKIDLRISPLIGNKEILYGARAVMGEDGIMRSCDCNLFYYGILNTHSYSVTDDELIFFGSAGISGYGGHLVFVPHDGVNPSTSFIGTEWKLSGVVDDQTGFIKELEPKDCEECYTLWFRGEYIFFGTSIQVKLIPQDLANLMRLDPITPNPQHDPRPCYDEVWKREWSDENGWHLIENKFAYNEIFWFRVGIAYAEKYERSSEELKLFFSYQEKNYYLLFKLKPTKFLHQ